MTAHNIFILVQHHNSFEICKTKVAKEKFYGAKNPIKIWEPDVDNIAISKSVEIKNNSKYLIGCLEDHLRL